MKIKELLIDGEKRLLSMGKESGRIDALLLLCFLTGMDRTQLFMAYDNEVTEDLSENFMGLIERRGDGVPVQHIVGSTNFMGFEFKVSPNVLIPRPETELLVEEALKVLKPGSRVLEICTGSGCIALSILKLYPETIMVASDISKAAIHVAMDNADALGVATGNSRGNIEFKTGDMFEHVVGKFDLIIVNPPYIKTEDIKTLETEVKDHDPHMALDGGPDGLFFYRRLIDEAKNYLNPEGKLLLEIGYDQAEDIAALIGDVYKNIKVIKDYSGNDRIMIMEK